MVDLFTLAAVLLVGLLLGGFFFGGLHWTVGRGLSSERPALWFLGSWLVRMTVVLGGFYLVSDGRWERFLACTAGFFIARVLTIRLTRPAVKPGISKPEAGDAS